MNHANFGLGSVLSPDRHQAITKINANLHVCRPDFYLYNECW